MNIRRLLLLSLFCVVGSLLWAQVPQAFHYQMVVRDAGDQLVRSQSIGLRLTIQRANAGSPVVLYQETQTLATDLNGLLQVEVGRGTRNPSYGLFADIPWGDYTDIELKADADPAGGTAYTLSATQPLQAVPYAFLSAESQGLGNAASLGNHAGGLQLKSVKDPTDDQDVVTKRYFDSVMAELVRRNNTLTRDTAACVLPASLPFAWRGHSCSASGVYTHRLAGVGPGGVDSVIILTLTASNGTHNSETVSQSGAYTWHGTPYAASGTYTYAYTDASGCPSVDTLHLTITASVLYGDTTASECGGFNWYGTPYLASGNYTHTFVGGGTGGLDSILTLHLTVKPFGSKTITETHCDTYHWDLESADYTSSGTYYHVIAGGSANGCDSTVTLDLTINQSVIRDSTANECEHFEWYGTDYTTSGPQTKTFAAAAANGCDSTVRLALTIRAKATFTDTRSACDSYTWIDGNTYTVDNNSATYTFTGGAANGCDSTVTLNLTIHHATVGTDTRTECDSYTWIDGNTYTVSNNTAEFHTTNVAGCDSTVTLNLTIHQSSTAIDQQVSCDSYTWIDGNTYNASTTTPTHTLTNAAGCDSTVTLNLTINASSSSNETENVCGDMATYNGNSYPASTSGATYDVVTVNGVGCPHTTHLTVYNRAYTGSGLSFDTVCAGTTSYTWTDWNDESLELQDVPVYSEGFEGLAGTGNAPTGWSRAKNNANTTGFGGYGTFGEYVPSAQSGSKFFIDVSTRTDDYSLAGAYTPSFTLTGGQTTISFYYRSYTSYYISYIYTYLTPESSIGSDWQGSTSVYDIFDEVETYNESWTQKTVTFTSTPGNYSLCFMHMGANLSFFAIDNIVVTEKRNVTVYTPHVTDLSSTPNGSNWTSGVTTNAYGCPVSGRYIHKRAVGETYTEQACESYRWINGTNYTTNQSNTIYTHSRTYNGTTCSVKDTLNLTISSPVGNAYTRSATNNYTWATSGADGHGTGLTYGYSGDYVGPNYVSGSCNVRDTLHLTVNRVACAGSKYTVSSCTPFTWAASGSYGKGTGTTYSTLGTNQYIGPAYTPAGCDEAIHDTLILTYGTAASTRYDVTECDSYTWASSGSDGHGTATTYSTLGTNRYTGPTYYTAVGCASVDTLNLTLNASTHTEETQSVCNGLMWHGINRTTTGDHVYDYTNGGGCPSTEILHLTINNKVFDTAITVCAGTTSVPTSRRKVLYYENFEDAATMSDWTLELGDEDYTLTGWQRVSNSKTYDGGYSLLVQTPHNNEYVWGTTMAQSPFVHIEDPARTELTFLVRLPVVYNWEGNYYPDLMEVYYYTDGQDLHDIDNYTSQVIWTNSTGASRTAANSWTLQGGFLDALGISSAGDYSFVFRDYDAWSYAAVDEITLEGPDSIQVPQDLPIGTPTTRTVVYTAANGCDSTVNITWTVTSCGGHIDLNIDPSFASPMRESHPTPDRMEGDNSHGDCLQAPACEQTATVTRSWDANAPVQSEAGELSAPAGQSAPSDGSDDVYLRQALRPRYLLY